MTLPSHSSDSFLGPDVVVEGIVRGHGNLHVAGRVKGTVAVTGDVTIEAGALIDGEVKAASLTVAPGARMRGAVEFGWKGDTVALGAAEQASAAPRGAGGGPRSAAS